MKYIVTIFVFLALCDSAFAQGSFYVGKWRQSGTFIYNSRGDSAAVIVGTDTTWFGANVIRRGNDTVSELGPAIEGDELGTGLMDSITAAYDSSQVGYLNPADANVDTAHWNVAWVWGDHSGQGYITNSKLSDSSITLLNATAWRLFYSNATTTAIQELALGSDGTYLKSNGASSAPTWATPSGVGSLLDTIATKDTTVLIGAAAGDTTLRIYRTTGGADTTTVTPETGVLKLGLEGTTHIDSLIVELIKDADSVSADALYVTGNIACAGTVDTVDVGGMAAKVHREDLKYFMFNLADPDALYATDHEWCIDPRTAQAITIDSFTVSLTADPTTELEFSLKFADALIGLANDSLIDDTATVAGVTTVTSGFVDNTIPAGKCLYWLFDADPDDAITQVPVKIYYSID